MTTRQFEQSSTRRFRAPAMKCARRDGRGPVALGRRGQGDLVITDVVMPDDNAFELLPRIKRLRPDLPIIVMSAQKRS